MWLNDADWNQDSQQLHGLFEKSIPLVKQISRGLEEATQFVFRKGFLLEGVLKLGNETPFRIPVVASIFIAIIVYYVAGACGAGLKFGFVSMR